MPRTLAFARTDAAVATERVMWEMWPPGQRVGRYVIRQRIGRGGMGSVYRADDLELGRTIAIKRLHADTEALAHKWLMREARSAAQLSHPNVVTVHEVGEVDGVSFLAMELVDGETLTTWLRTQPRPWLEIVEVLAQAGRGLAAAHDRGLVHRDFKPDNVLVDRDGRARVADFGLAIAELGDPGAVARTRTLAATTVGLAGTPAYLAPEIINGEPPDARSDQYAYAITLFEALHGRHPFAGATADVVWTEMAAGRIRAGTGNVPVWLEQRVRRGLAVDPNDRWPSVAAFIAAIQDAPRRGWPKLVAAAGAIAVASVGVLVLRSSSPVDDCERGAALVDSVWTPAVQAAQAQRFASAAPHRDGAIATSGKLLDGWSDDWRLGRRAACHAEPEMRAPRLDCLDHELGELRAQLSAWGQVDADVVDRVLPAITSLPRPQDCIAHPPPIGKAPRELVARIDELDALARAGRPRVADPKLASVIADAEAINDPETLARALGAAAWVDEQLGRRESARDRDVRAAREAGLAGDDNVMFEAMIHQAMLAIDDGHASDAAGIIDAADALVARSKLDREDRVAIERGHVLLRLGKTADAITSFKRAIEILEPRAARDRQARIQLAAALGALGSALGWQGRPDEGHVALARALAIEEVELGADNPEVGRSLNDLANQEFDLNRLDDALAHFKRARRIFAAADGERSELVGSIDIALANIEGQRGHYDDARRLYASARSELSMLPPDHPTLATIENGLFNCDRAQDRNTDAARHIARGIEILERAGQSGEEFADQLVNYAQVLIDLKRDREARVQVDKALAVQETAGVSPKGRVSAWHVVALLDWNAGHKSQAIAEARHVVATIGDDERTEWAKMRKDVEAEIAEWMKK